MELAVKLQAVLQRLYPGLCRNLTVRSSAFNQDLSPGALLIEVGTAGDTRQDALYAAELLADGIAELSHGSM
jgi:stage II sporulation protein P